MTVVSKHVVGQHAIDMLVAKAAELNIDWTPELQALGDGPYITKEIATAIGQAAVRLDIDTPLANPEDITSETMKAFLGG